MTQVTKQTHGWFNLLTEVEIKFVRNYSLLFVIVQLNAISKITFVLLIFIINTPEPSINPKWIHHFIKYIKKDSNIVQAVLIVYGCTESHDSISDIAGIIQQHLSSKIHYFNNNKIDKNFGLKSGNFGFVHHNLIHAIKLTSYYFNIF